MTATLQTLKKSITIDAPKNKIWDVLLKDETYRIWTSAFNPGSYAETDWKEGSKVYFLADDGSGLVSRIKEHKPGELIVIEHLGLVQGGEEVYEHEELKNWKGATEIYRLEPKNGSQQLIIEQQTSEGEFEMFSEMWDKALEIIKELSEAAAGEKFVITRTLDASREEVFKAWTEPGRLAQWWGPAGFNIQVVKLDLQPGGMFHHKLTSDAGDEMWGRFVYRNIRHPERLVFINSFSDESGGLTRAPFSATWPLEMHNILTLEEISGKTLMTLKGGAINATDEERKTYEAGFESMHQGFSGTFDQLEAYLKSEQ